jgi:NADH:ubiquinone oxidoreductase subunit 4 (subunit M)
MTPEKRSIVYTSVAGLVPVLVAAGYLTDALGQAILNLVAAGIAVAALIMARKHTPKKVK